MLYLIMVDIGDPSLISYGSNNIIYEYTRFIRHTMAIYSPTKITKKNVALYYENSSLQLLP